jgi:hypothetical protein
MSPGAYDVFWKAMSPEIIAHPGDLLVHYDDSEEIKLLMQKKTLMQFHSDISIQQTYTERIIADIM